VRANLTKQKLRDGRCVFGVFIPMAAPRLVEWAGLAGFDYVLIDAEHGPIEPAACEDLVRAAEVMNLTPLVRVPENNDKLILRYLDVGAQGIMVPQVNSVEDAERAVRAVKYAPRGRRGLAGARAASYGYRTSLSDYTRRANDETMVLVQIENINAVKALDGIMAVDGIDVFELGQADLSQSMGYPGETSHPEVLAAIETIVSRVLGAGKIIGDTTNDPKAAVEYLKRGYRMLDCSLTGLAIRALASIGDAMREAVPR
jgi:4-hydroxy-2-oxoheptanedioate aldolase